MGLFVNTNTASLNARRHLNGSTRGLERQFERLSSGMRINSARDDAAGMAIATRFTSQIRGLNQAVRNTNDGISMAQTVEGALDETGAILQRMRELSIQAASDTNTLSDREAIQLEVTNLIEEINRIAQTTRFNDQKVLNGEFAGSKFHIGYKSNDTISVKTMDARANILGRQARYDGGTMNAEAFDNGDLVLNSTTIRGTVASDDTVSTSLAAGSAIAKAAAINDMSIYTGVSATVGKTEFVADLNPLSAVTLDSTNYMIINGAVISGFRVEDDDANNALIDTVNSFSNETGVIARLDQNLQLTLEAEDGRNIELTVNGLATNLGFAAGNQVQAGTVTLQSEEAIFMSQTDAGVEKLGLGADPAGGDTLLGTNSDFAVDTIDVTTREGANISIEILDVAIAQVSDIRSDLGAVQNRLQSTVNNLSTTQENVSAARSRIQDADFATETAAMARNQILQNAGISILAQANQAPNNVLQLLG
ncbi:MAG: flagellin [Myxococcales bacterium]|nr:flagellin [Myxococcales bacterium]